MLFPDARGTSRSDAISGFLAYARERLEPLGVWVSADIFGYSTKITTDQGTGQILEKVAQNVDIVSPMVYPSLYSDGWYNLPSPNANPSALVTGALKDATPRMVGLGAMLRPWLQAYPWNGVPYGPTEVKAEIQAAEQQGYTEWMLWDASMRYPAEAPGAQGS